MKTNVASLLRQIESGDLKSNTALVLKWIRERGALNKRDLMKLCGKSHQTITSRLSDLQDMGIIEVVSYSDSDVNFYKYQSDPNKQVRNAFARKYERYERWKKKGEEFREFIVSESEPIMCLKCMEVVCECDGGRKPDDWKDEVLEKYKEGEQGSLFDEFGK